MFTDLVEEGRKRILQTFPERQLYLRSGGEVRYYVISTRLQVTVVSALMVMALWCVVSMANIVLGVNPFSKPATEMRRLEAHYEQLLDDARVQQENARSLLAEQREDFVKAAKTFEEKHETISQILKSSGQDVGAARLPSAEYADSHILVAPVVRDALPRQSRSSFKKKSELGSHAIELGAPLRNIEDTQNSILVAAEIDTLNRIEQGRAVIGSTGLNVETVLRANNIGKGGPFIAMDAVDTAKNEGDFAPRTTSIKARIAEVEALKSAMNSMPFSHPIDAEYFQTSPYGTRKDPFTHRPTFHGGMDFGSYRMAPIVATAPGKISYVGWRGGYGRVVEIDHGHGFKTRYAHLAKTHVKRGQSVDTGTKIGGMGSSGRSTSTHLHYEIHFQDQEINPDKFLKAARYVQ